MIKVMPAINNKVNVRLNRLRSTIKVSSITTLKNKPMNTVEYVISSPQLSEIPVKNP